MGDYRTFPFPSDPTFNLAPAVSPFDVRSISDSINRAAESLDPSERGAMTVQLNQAGAGAGLVVRAGPVKILGTITKPRAGKFGWSVSGKVSFLIPGVPKPVWFMPEFRGFYRLFRERGDDWFRASWKAFDVLGGKEVRLDG